MLRLSGTVAYGAADHQTALEPDATVVYLVVGAVKQVIHEKVLGRLTRGHAVKVVSAYQLDAGEADALLAEAKRRQEAMLDRILGRAPLPFDDPPAS